MKKMNYIIPVLVLLCIIVFASGQAKRDKGDTGMGFEQISQLEAKRIMANEKGYIIVDARTEGEYVTGHIPGAICIPNESIGTAMPAELPDKEQLILVYCRSGRRSKIAAQALVDLGYTNVKEFGGIIDWKYDTVK